MLGLEFMKKVMSDEWQEPKLDTLLPKPVICWDRGRPARPVAVETCLNQRSRVSKQAGGTPAVPANHRLTKSRAFGA